MPIQLRAGWELKLLANLEILGRFESLSEACD